MTPPGGSHQSLLNEIRGLSQKSFLVGLTTVVLVMRRRPHPVASGSNTAVCPILSPTASTYAVDLAGIQTACLLASNANLKFSVTTTFCSHVANSRICDKTLMLSNTGSFCPDS